KVMQYDQGYADAMAKTDPDFKSRVKYATLGGEIPPPPTPTQQLAKLRDDIKSGLGYNVTGLDVGGRQPIDVSVRPGQTIGDAIAEQLRAGGRTVGYDAAGNLVDQGSGKVIVPVSRLDQLGRDFDKKVNDKVFGEGQTGFDKN